MWVPNSYTSTLCWQYILTTYTSYSSPYPFAIRHQGPSFTSGILSTLGDIFDSNICYSSFYCQHLNILKHSNLGVYLLSPCLGMLSWWAWPNHCNALLFIILTTDSCRNRFPMVTFLIRSLTTFAVARLKVLRFTGLQLSLIHI